jgi:hypothetical protein
VGGGFTLSVFKKARSVKSGGLHPGKFKIIQPAGRLPGPWKKGAGFFVSEQIHVGRWVKKYLLTFCLHGQKFFLLLT